MTKEDYVEQVSKDSPAPQEQPFHIVLIDLVQMFQARKIQCVEKPLEGGDTELKFVALSYRWGEVQETALDIQLDYLATITSFDLDDLCHLCERIAQEPDLQSLNYVWVDAICVDQANYERRKATIHHMSAIYEKATYILAVPDLHKRHVQALSEAHFEALWYMEAHNDYIYHLLHQDTDQLDQLDHAFLTTIGVPDDPQLRHKLLKHYFADGLTTYRPSNWPYDSMEVLDHVYQENQVACAKGNDKSDYQRWLDDGEDDQALLTVTSSKGSWRQQIYVWET
ncbi:unnamed protein product [Absidia cylindrospora]